MQQRFNVTVFFLRNALCRPPLNALDVQIVMADDRRAIVEAPEQSSRFLWNTEVSKRHSLNSSMGDGTYHNLNNHTTIRPSTPSTSPHSVFYSSSSIRG